MKHLALMLAIFGVAVTLAACGGGGSDRGAPVVVGPGPVDPIDPPVMPSEESLSLPSGHGLSAGEIRVAPGGSAERGNVVVSCPAGGSACVVTVAADGTASYDRTGGVPSVMAQLRPNHNTGWFDNTTAADLADHWHVTVAPASIADALSLQPAPMTAGDTFKKIADAAGVDAPANLQVLGQSDGYTVGRWTSGPADHMPIKLDWSFSPNEPTSFRAHSDRAAKMFSHHISGVLEPFTITQGRQVYDHIVPEDIITHGTYIFVLRDEQLLAESGASGLASSLDVQISDRTTHGRFGAIWMAELYRSQGGSGTLATHEIMHVLTPINPGRTRYADVARGTWTGPAATAVYGKPIPFTSVNGVVDWAHFGILEGTFETAHSVIGRWLPPGATRSGNVIEYPPDFDFGSLLAEPSPLDVAYLDDLGYDVVTDDVAKAEEIYSLGAWGEVSGFSVLVARDLDAKPESFTQVTPTGGFMYSGFDDDLRASATAFGADPGTSFAVAHEGMIGAATWSGLLLGADLGSEGLPSVTGKSAITVGLSTLEGNVRFTDLQAHSAGNIEPFRSPTLTYDVSVGGNTFADAERRVRGAWFGDDHGEIAGTLLDQRPEVQLIAGFGAKRN